MADDCLSEQILDNFDVELQDFYYHVILSETGLDTMWKTKVVQRAMLEIVEQANKKDRSGPEETSLSCDTMSKRCAYVLKHSTCFTSAAAKYIMKLVNHSDENQIILYRILKLGQLKICCLGGGPATDAVAVIKIVRELYSGIWRKTGKKLDVRVTVIDLNRDWHRTARNVFSCLKRNAAFFDMNMLELEYKFLTADLTQPFSEEVMQTLRSADILTMVYFVSAVNACAARDRSLEMIQNIMLHMKKGAILFFLDSAEDMHYKMLNKAAEKWPSMKEIYGLLVQEYHTISLESVSKFLELHANRFDKFFCLTDVMLSVSSWYKMKTKVPRIMIYKELFRDSISCRIPSQEENYELAKKMLAYRDLVKKLVRSANAKKANKNFNTIRKSNLIPSATTANKVLNNSIFQSSDSTNNKSVIDANKVLNNSSPQTSGSAKEKLPQASEINALMELLKEIRNIFGRKNPIDILNEIRNIQNPVDKMVYVLSLIDSSSLTSLSRSLQN